MAEEKVDHLLLMIIFVTIFIRRAPEEDNTTQERIHIVAATYGCRESGPFVIDDYFYD